MCYFCVAEYPHIRSTVNVPATRICYVMTMVNIAYPLGLFNASKRIVFVAAKYALRLMS